MVISLFFTTKNLNRFFFKKLHQKSLDFSQISIYISKALSTVLSIFLIPTNKIHFIFSNVKRKLWIRKSNQNKQEINTFPTKYLITSTTKITSLLCFYFTNCFIEFSGFLWCYTYSSCFNLDF